MVDDAMVWARQNGIVVPTALLDQCGLIQDAPLELSGKLWRWWRWTELMAFSRWWGRRLLVVGSIEKKVGREFGRPHIRVFFVFGRRGYIDRRTGNRTLDLGIHVVNNTGLVKSKNKATNLEVIGQIPVDVGGAW
jgi:hypothetical protein